MKKLSLDEAFALTSPLPYVTVSLLDKNDKPNVIGVAWVTRTSWNPFLMLISIDHSRYSHEGIRLHKEFVINYPSKDQKDMAWLAGTKSGRDTDKIKEGNIELVPSQSVKTPTIKDATAALECVVVSEHETGDHTVFVGKVVAVSGKPENGSTLFCNSKFKIIALDGTGQIQD